MLGGALITASTLSPLEDTFLALWSTRPPSALGPPVLSSPRAKWRPGVRAVRLEIVLDGRLNDCLMLSMLMLGPLDEEARSEDPEDVLDLNLVLLRMSRFSGLSSSLSVSSGSKSKDRSCKSWLLNLELPRALVLDPWSLGKILTLFIFLFRRPVVSLAPASPRADVGVVCSGLCCLMTLGSPNTGSSTDPPQFFWQLTLVLKLFPFPPHPPYL